MTLRGRCTCGAIAELGSEGGRFTSSHVCKKPAQGKDTGTSIPDRSIGRSAGVPGSGAVPASPAPRRWSNATPTTCGDGHRHASKLEARTCNRLTAEAKASGWTLVQQVAFELTTIAPKRPGLRHKLRVDFLLIPPGWRAVESKGRLSRDFQLRADAFEAAHGKPLEIVTK